MFSKNDVPYCPMKLIPDDKDTDYWLIHNPINDHEHEVNQTGYQLLRHCDGYRTWGEIVEELARDYKTSDQQIVAGATPILNTLADEGILWWRQDRMQLWRLPPPTFVLWDLTNRCNLRCRHCVVSAGQCTEGELSTDECYDLIDQLKKFGVQMLVLSGGEPLIRCDFFEIAEYAVQQGLELQIATNAALVTEETAKRLASIHASTQVSLDGATAEVHDDFRQVPGTWKRTLQGIHHLVQAGVPVMIAATVTKANIDQIPTLYDLAAELGAQTFRILPFVPCGRGSTAWELEVAPAQMREVTAYLHQKRESGGLPIAPMEFECTLAPPNSFQPDKTTHIGCDGAISYCTINFRGEVLPCNFFSGTEAENIREHSFAWIWENSRFLNYFRSLRVSDIHGHCQDCEWLSNCRGSCLAANFFHSDIFQSNCHCWLVNSPSNNDDFPLSLTDKPLPHSKYAKTVKAIAVK